MCESEKRGIKCAWCEKERKHKVCVVSTKKKGDVRCRQGRGGT